MNNKLDNILKEWAEKKKPHDQHLHELTGQIRTEAAQVKYNDVVEDVPISIPFFSKLSYAAFGVAASVLVMMAVQFTAKGDAAAALTKIPCDKLEVRKKLFAEMSRIFPEKLRWVAESGGDVNMGIESISGGVDEASEPILVRVSIVAREGGKMWKPVWNSDIMLRGEELAEVMPGRDDNKIALWVYALNDGKIAVDTNLALDVPVRFAVKKNLVVKPGEPVELLSMTDDNVEYKVFQTVSPLI